MSLESDGSDVEYKIDRGAQVNVLPYKQCLRLQKKPKLRKTGIQLSAYNRTSIPVTRRCTLHVVHKSKTVPVMFIVANTNAAPILGLKSSANLNLIKRVWQVDNDVPEYILNESGHCFGGIGCLSKPYHITLEPDVTPVVHPPRNVPISTWGKLKKRLGHIVDLNIITPVTEPTDQVNSLAAVEKPNGSLRICLDPRDLNQAIKRQHYKLSTTEGILSQMLDASTAYWQIPLDEESSKLLTFNAPIGKYRFLQMPFGIHSASETCQQSGHS